jgi:hypothetical protein
MTGVLQQVLDEAWDRVSAATRAPS